MTLGDTQAHRHVIGEGLLLGKRTFASAAGKGIFRPSTDNFDAGAKTPGFQKSGLSAVGIAASFSAQTFSSHSPSGRP